MKETITDIRISLNMDDLTYMADYIAGGHLNAICESANYHDTLRDAKDFAERQGKPARIMAHDGMIYDYNGRRWTTTRPSNR